MPDEPRLPRIPRGVRLPRVPASARLPRVGGQPMSRAELRAYFAATNVLRKPIGQYSDAYIRRVASAQIRGEAVNIRVSRQAARRGGAAERPGRVPRQAPAIPRFIRQVLQTEQGRHYAPRQRSARQATDTLAEFGRVGVERVRVVGRFRDEAGNWHEFTLGGGKNKTSGYNRAYLARLLAEHGGDWESAIGELLTQAYGGYEGLDMGSIAFYE